MYKLSLLLPSKRPESLERFLTLLKANSSDYSKIQVIVLVDDELESVHYMGNVTEIHFPKQKEFSLGVLLSECYKHVKADWVMFANDDLLPETKGWDEVLFTNIEKHASDQVGLFWPNDDLFGPMLSCFPIVSKKVLDAIDYFPTDYIRYKMDDTLFHIFPPERRFYLADVMFRHITEPTEHGFRLPSGKIYPVDQKIGEIDQKKWVEKGAVRSKQRRKVYELASLPLPLKVLIGVSTAEYARRADFYDYVDLLVKPAGTQLSKAHGQSPAKNRNLIIEHALREDFTHIFFLDDDVAFKPDTLLRLLSHNKDIVSGLYYKRNFPHEALVFDYAHPDGACRYMMLNGHQGLVPIVAAGLGACLIKVDVFRGMEQPWIRLGEFPQTKDDWCDDIGFFNRVRKETKAEIYCDLDIPIGHMASMTVWPDKKDGKWMTVYETMGQAAVAIERPIYGPPNGSN